MSTVSMLEESKPPFAQVLGGQVSERDPGVRQRRK